MIHADPYGAGDDDHDDLPQLPIARPGEWSPMAASQRREEPRISPPSLGGGASFTAAGGDDDGATTDEPPQPSWARDDRDRVESERFVWELAARLTSGMLANSARSTSSVKDAMGLFDQFLHEMHAYTKIASEFDLLGGNAERRRTHEEYFQQRATARRAATPPPTSDQAPPPAAATPSKPKPKPTQPRPMGDYRPIPPGARGPYAPGSMAGSPPPEPSDDERAA